jgi:hypothetical protein
MACERYESRIIDEALAPGGDAELTSHLSGCSGCRAELDRQRVLQDAISGSISAIVAAEPSPALLTRVRQRVDAIDAIVAEDSARRRAAWMQWTITGVGVAALAGLAIFFAGRALLRQSNSGPQLGQTAAGTPAPQTSARNQTPQTSIPPVSAHGSTASAPTSSAAKQRAVQIKPARAKAPRPDQSVQLAATRDQAPIAPVAATGSANGAPGLNVIVPPGQREAVLRLVAAMKNGRVNVASLLKESEQQQMTPIEIAPIKITPLEEKKAGSQSDGNHQ